MSEEKNGSVDGNISRPNVRNCCSEHRLPSGNNADSALGYQRVSMSPLPRGVAQKAADNFCILDGSVSCAAPPSAAAVADVV